MKRVIFGLFLFTFSLSLQSQPIGIMQVRQMYFEGWEGQCGATELFGLLSKTEINQDVILLAYKGAELSTLANCKWNPYSKFSIFNDGKKLLEQAISQSPESIEARFLRFTIQTNIPSILNYDNIDIDKTFLLKSLNLPFTKDSDQDLMNRIIKYMFETGNISEEENIKLKQLIAKG